MSIVRNTKAIVAFLLVGVIITACSVSTANISDVKIGESKGQSEVEKEAKVIAPDAPQIFMTAHLNNAPDDTKIKITWRYLEDGGQDIDSVDVTNKSGENIISSSLSSPTNGWPKGKYEVVLKIDSDNSEPVKGTFEVK